MNKYHKIGKVYFNEGKLILMIDGKEYEFQLSQISDKLKHASEIEKERYQISPSGYGIHWPLIDEDLSIDSLLGISHMPPKNKQAIGISTFR